MKITSDIMIKVRKMVDRIEGADWSHWQGNPDCSQFKAAGGRFVGIKVSQDVGYKDDKAEVNNANAHAQGLFTFPYHFVGLGSPTTQYDWFIKCIGTMKFDLAPALDYEAYNPLTLEPFMELRNITDFYLFNNFNRVLQSYGLVIPSASTLYSIATKLKGWRGFQSPAIYTNVSTANSKLINTAIYNWAQFLLWLAQWSVTIPTIPTAWKSKQIYIWQDRVIRDAQIWGVDGDMDHDFWMEALPFPGVTPPPNKVSLKLYIQELGKTIEVNNV